MAVEFPVVCGWREGRTTQAGVPVLLEALFYRSAGLMVAEFPVVCRWREPFLL